MKIKYVKQEHDTGCAIACFAMILDKTYKQICSSFSDRVAKNGLSTSRIQSYLGEQGFSLIVKRSLYNKVVQNNIRMRTPFAHIHFVSVKVFSNSKSHHAVVMDSKGRVYDPAQEWRRKLSDYYEITEVIGLFKD